jgi:hypothetical protein
MATARCIISGPYNFSAHQQDARYGRVPANLATSHIIICGAITATIDSGKTQRRRQRFIAKSKILFWTSKCKICGAPEQGDLLLCTLRLSRP